MIAHIDVVLPAKEAVSYPIYMGAGILDALFRCLPNKMGNLVLITDHYLKKHHVPILVQALTHRGYQPLVLSLAPGEESKNIRSKSRLESARLRHGCGRDSLILALGGGVVGDLAGFVAATFMRGIPLIQMPTTLMAMLDSAVGGKTAINTLQGKNLIGAFWQPMAVIIDVHYLKTLPMNHLVNGLIEAVKMFLSADVQSLFYLVDHLPAILNCDDAVLIELVQRAVRIKARIVEQDEKEQHQRVILNLGHTMGHAIEKLSHYQILHGYAVALGLLVEAKIAVLIGVLDPKHYSWIKEFLMQLGISAHELKQFDVDALLEQTKADKKNRAGLVHYVLLNNLGSVFMHDQRFAHPVADEVVRQALLATIED